MTLTDMRSLAAGSAEVSDSASAAGANDYLEQVISSGLPANVVGERVVEALAAGEFYIVTHASYFPMVQSRFRTIEQAFDTAAGSAVLSDVDIPAMPSFGD